MDQIVVLSIILLACFVQSLSGFGLALVAIGLLPGRMDMHTAVPLVALISLTLQTGLLLIYRDTFKLRNIAPIIVAAVLSLPIGIWAFTAY